jgi:hypothetical protein
LVYSGPCRYIGNGHVDVGINTGRGILHLDTKNTIIPFAFSRIEYWSSVRKYFGYSSDGASVFSATGKLLFTYPADTLRAYKADLYIAHQKGKYGLLKAPATWVVKPIYTILTVSGALSEQVSLPVIAYAGQKAVLLSAEGEVVSEKYDSLRYVGQGYYAAKAGNKYRFIDRLGKPSSETAYGYIANFSDGLCLVKSGEGFLFLNRNLTQAFSLPLQAASSFNGGTAVVTLRGKRVSINKMGKVVSNLP